MSWTEQRIQQLKNLHADSLSASQIAAEMGGLTRNAVIGKLHRLGLVSQKVRKPSPPKMPVAPRRRVRSNSNVPRMVHRKGKPPPTSVELPPEPAAKPNCEPISIVHLTDKTCRWPMGEVETESFAYCGSPEADNPRAPYCRYHSQIAYTAPNERQRRAAEDRSKRLIPLKANY